MPSLRLDLERALFPRLERLGVLRLHAAPVEVRDDAAFRQQCAWLARLGPTEIGLHAAICKVFAHLSVWNAHSADCAAPSADAVASAAASPPIAWSSSGTVHPWFPFSKAIQTLHSLNYLRVPADMMNCLLRTIQAIAEQARAYYSAAESSSSAAQSSAVHTLAAADPAPAPVAAATHARHLVLDADTLFPLVLWAVIHARLEQSGPHYLLAHADRFAVPHSHPSFSSASASDDASNASDNGNDGASTERRRHRSSNADTTQRPSESAADSSSSSSSSSSSYASYGPASYARTLIEAAVRLVVTIDPSQLFLSEASARFHDATEAALLAAAAAQSAAAKSTNSNGAPNSTPNAPFDPTGGNPGSRSASALAAANGKSKSAAASKKTRDEVDEAAKEVSLMSLMM